MNVLPLIIAGGFGRRLFPLSTDDLPKQFIPFFKHGDSSFQNTIKRIRNVFITEKIAICINQRHVGIVKKQLKKLREENYILICERASKNTFASVLLGLKLAKNLKNIDSLFVVPTDSFIENEDWFSKNIQTAILQSMITEKHVVFGVKPNNADSRYGYIKINSCKNKIFEECEFFNVDRFVEKPALVQAEKFIRQGNYFWNSGHFVFNVKNLENEVASFQSKAWQIFIEMKLIRTSKNFYATNNLFLELPNIQIDKAIVEKSKNLLCCKAEFDWCDIGSFNIIEHLVIAGKITIFG